MIKLAAVGIWACLVTAGSAYMAVLYSADQAAQEGDGSPSHAIEYIKTEITSVPVIRSGQVEGYVVFQLSVAIDPSAAGHDEMDPTPFAVDEAFRTIYADPNISSSSIEKHDFEKTAKAMAENINSRLGIPLVKDVLVLQFNYVARDNVRTQWIKPE